MADFWQPPPLTAEQRSTAPDIATFVRWLQELQRQPLLGAATERPYTEPLWPLQYKPGTTELMRGEPQTKAANSDMVTYLLRLLQGGA